MQSTQPVHPAHVDLNAANLIGVWYVPFDPPQAYYLGVLYNNGDGSYHATRILRMPSGIKRVAQAKTLPGTTLDEAIASLREVAKEMAKTTNTEPYELLRDGKTYGEMLIEIASQDFYAQEAKDNGTPQVVLQKDHEPEILFPKPAAYAN